jgi:hypothetical protein
MVAFCILFFYFYLLPHCKGRAYGISFHPADADRLKLTPSKKLPDNTGIPFNLRRIIKNSKMPAPATPTYTIKDFNETLAQERWRVCYTASSQQEAFHAVTHPSTDHCQPCLTSVISSKLVYPK